MGYLLVVDDDDGICEIIGEILTDEGYEVACARDGEHALRLLQERAPAVVLFDLVMPNWSGEDFISACRQVLDRSVPMVVVSAMPNLDRVAERIGADHFLAKPFDLTDLLDTVQAALAARDVA